MSAGFFDHAAVVSDLRAKYRRFQQGAVANAQNPAVLLDLLFVDCQHFGNDQIDYVWTRGLLRQLPIKFAEFFIRTPIGFHHFRSDEMLRRHNVVNVVLDGLFRKVPLRLPVFPGNAHQLFAATSLPASV